jgi:gliding motility-associated-like protein
MRKIHCSITLLIAILLSGNSHAQDFSNKGRDFWVGYGYHQVMNGGGNVQEMVLYFATDVATVVNVSIPSNGYTATYNIAANTVAASSPLPKAGVQDARLLNEGIYNTGIHITADHDIVAYAHIYNQSVSGATILFPTNTLGRQYYSVNYTNTSNTTNANCWAYVIATDTGTTTVQITPTATTLDGSHTPGNPFTVSLTQGQIYNMMGTTSGSNGVDLTGSYIESVATPTTPCKRIAVFSGSGRIAISCNGSAPSSDNYMVQGQPISTWGKHFLTVPGAAYGSVGGTGLPLTPNFYRICVQSPLTNVTVNGAPVGVPLTNGFYYQINATSQPLKIDADQPIFVAQYFPSQGNTGCGNGAGDGDPETIYLSPIEQSISKVRWNACRPFQINPNKNWINVIIPNGGTAISSFKLDGAPVSPTMFSPHPNDPNYSYAVLNVAGTSTPPGLPHVIESDSGFNAIAYGYGQTESYGYNAGTNVKDLYQFVMLHNAYATVNFPAACENTPFNLSIVLPYQPTQLTWNFNGLFPNVTIGPSPPPVYDSSWVVNGKTVYRYTLPTPYTITTPGNYPIQILATNPLPDGCNGLNEINFDLQVFPPPTSDFTFTSSGCLSDSVHFFGNPQNLSNRPVSVHSWSFGDGGNAAIQNPVHLYTGVGSYNVGYSVITDVGCLSDTVYHTVAISPPPNAMFTIAGTQCEKQTITFIDQSSAAPGATINNWRWDFGDGSPIINAANGNPQPHVYNNPGSYIATLTVTTSGGCQSLQFFMQINIGATPLANFSFAGACLPSGLTQFTDQSTVSVGSIVQWAWSFGDGGTATTQNPSHNYATTGPFNVTLQVTTNGGCPKDTTKVMNTVYAQPVSNFNVNTLTACLGTTFNFTDNSTAPNNTVSKWRWNFGDGSPIDTTQNPTHAYATAGTYTVTHWVISAAGCMSDTMTKTITVHALPTANFNFSVPNCLNQPITFTDVSVPNSGTLSNWSWNFGDASTSSSQNPTHSYGTTGNFNVTLQVTSSFGCTSTVVTKPVTINVSPIANFGIPVSCLLDPNSQFTDSSSITGGTISGWSWNFGDPNATAGNPNTSGLQNPTHQYTAAGPYNITLTVTSSAGCTATVSKPFFVNGAVPIPDFTMSGPTSFCSGGSVSLTDNSTVNPGTVVRLEIYWDYNTDPTNRTVDVNPSPGKNYSYNYPQFTTPASRNVTIRYVAFSGTNCVQYIDRVITLYAIPAVQFNAVPGICEDVAPFQVTQAGITNGLTGNGVFSGPGVSSNGLFDPQAAGVGVHTIRYTFTSSDGCVDFKEQTIEVFALPTVDAGPDRFLLQNGSVVLAATATGSGLTYVWTPNIAISDVNILRPTVSPASDQFYYLRVTTAGGCTDSDSVFVKVLKGPVIPNIFSPNGDGVHDKWDISYLSSYPGCTVNVFNRYGQLIYKSIGYDTPWDGTVNGKPVPVGTYYYIIDPKNGRDKMTGYVDVIR